MRFYDREQEIDFLRETRKKAVKTACFTVVTGRRRIGKTTLIAKAYEDAPFVYFFVARKAEADLCDERIASTDDCRRFCLVFAKSACMFLPFRHLKSCKRY